MDLIEGDIKYGGDMFTTRLNLRIYDIIYDSLENSYRENTINQ